MLLLILYLTDRPIPSSYICYVHKMRFVHYSLYFIINTVEKVVRSMLDAGMGFWGWYCFDTNIFFCSFFFNIIFFIFNPRCTILPHDDTHSLISNMVNFVP